MQAVSLWGTHLNLPRVRFKRCGGSKQAVLREKLAHKAEDNIGLSQTTQSIVIIISRGGGLLQSAGNISTSRITVFLAFILKPISAEFCKNCPNEFCQDSRQYIGDLLMWKERLTKKLETAKQKPVFLHCSSRCESTLPKLV